MMADSVSAGFFLFLIILVLLISSGKFIKFLSNISFLNNKIKIQESQNGRNKFEINSADKLGIRHVLVALIYAILIITSLNAVQTISNQIHVAEENWYNLECSGSQTCSNLDGGEFKIGFFDTGHQRYPSDTLVEGSSNYDLGINTPWLWSIYLACAGFMLIGVLARLIREGNFYMKKHQKRREELALIPLLALDPDGVLEGRIALPETITPIPPTKLEYLLTIPILTLSILAFPQTFVIVVTDIFNGDTASTVFTGNVVMGEILIHVWITLFAIINCSTALILLGEFHATLSEDSSILSSEFTGVSEEESPVEEEINYDEPARLDAVIQILEMEMMRAREETEKLKIELKEVNERVVTLNTEIDEKNAEIDDMRAVKENMEIVAEKEEDSDSKSLTMADSVFVGDALFGSTKIDQQIVNDPKAIAMAAVEAYRMGRTDN